MVRWRALLKIAAVGVGIWAVYRLWSLVLLFLVSLLLALTLHPAVLWLQRRRLSRATALSIVVFVVLAVFIAVAGLLGPAVGRELGGVLGAVLALPLVAAYPIVERLWFRPALGDEAIEDHAALDRSLRDKEHDTVDRVIGGEEHPDQH